MEYVRLLYFAISFLRFQNLFHDITFLIKLSFANIFLLIFYTNVCQISRAVGDFGF